MSKGKMGWVMKEIMEKPIQPYPEECMVQPGVEKDAICQVLRDIYGLTDNADVRLKARICTTLAKRMHKRLLESLRKVGEKDAEILSLQHDLNRKG